MEYLDFTITLLPSHEPKAIDAVRSVGSYAGEVHRGIYELDDALTLCIPTVPSKARPLEFKSIPGGQLLLFRLKRAHADTRDEQLRR